MEFNRAIPVGRTLIEALNVLLERGQLTAQQAREILGVYDEVVAAELEQIPRRRLPERQQRTALASGRLEAYQILGSHWRVDASGVRLAVPGCKRRLVLDNTRFLFREEGGD